MSALPRFTFGVGDRFAHEAEAQLRACILAADQGVEVAGLKTTVFPVTRAALVIPVAMASGKFQGAITAATPLGS